MWKLVTMWCRAGFWLLKPHSNPTEQTHDFYLLDPNSASDVLGWKNSWSFDLCLSEIAPFASIDEIPKTKDRSLAMLPQHWHETVSRLWRPTIAYRVIVHAGVLIRRRFRLRCTQLTTIKTKPPSASFPNSKCNKTMTSRQISCRGRWPLRQTIAVEIEAG